jgi:hypothetical protein
MKTIGGRSNVTHVRIPFRIDSAEPTLNSAALVMALPLPEGDEISQSRQVRTCIGTRQASTGPAASEALYRSDIRCRIVLVPLGTPAARAKHERLAPSLACAHSEMPAMSAQFASVPFVASVSLAVTNTG